VGAGHGGQISSDASDEQKRALEALAGSLDRREADRARAILLTLKGWTSPEIAEVFCVPEDMVRFWRGDIARDGIEGIKASAYAGAAALEDGGCHARVHAAARSCPIAKQRFDT
jgi:hypothetical protein